MTTSTPDVEALHRAYTDVFDEWKRFTQRYVSPGGKQASELTAEERAEEIRLNEEITAKHQAWVRAYLGR